MTQTAPRKPFTGCHMSLIIVCFFAVVFAVNAMLAVSAYRSWTGLVVENSYVASQSFNIDTERLSKARVGISHTLHYKSGHLQLELFLADGKAALASDMEISLGRPAESAQDSILHLTPEADGRYGADVQIAPGIWIGNITGKIQGHADLILPFRLNVEGSN